MMHKFLGGLAVGVLALPAFAQNCVIGTPGVSLGAGGDVVYPIQPIGFAFPLAGQTFTNIHVCDKGYVYLSNAGIPAPGGADFTATAAELASGPPRICALWSDIQCLSGNSGACFLSSTTTQCTITWKNAQIYNNGLAGGPLFDMQMTLSPSGAIHCTYGPGTTNNSIASQPTWQVGITGVSVGGGVTLPAASDLSAGGATTDNTLFEQWLTPATFDMASAGLDMIPTNPGWTFFSAPSVNCASTSNYGTGCITQSDSFYEFSAMAAFDLSNTVITMLRTGNGYIVLNSLPGTFVPPTAAAQPVAMGLLDGQQQFTLSSAMPVAGGTTTTLNVTTKGQVEVGGPGSATIDYTPSAAELLADASTVFACWHDYDQTQAGSGMITFEEISGFAYVTWNGVYSYTTTTPNTMQFQFNLATGDLTLVIGAMSGPASVDNIVVGYSVAGPSGDPGATDLSSAFGAINIADAQLLGLALTANGLPTIGNSSFSTTATNVPPIVPLAFLFVGDTKILPGLDLTFLGMPGCFGYTNANIGSLSFPVSSMTWSGNQLLPIPNNAMFAGTQLRVQAVAFSLATPLNLVTSNGTEITVGF
ncbi:MAG TPA: hypothetical protein VFZ65_15715 [Planctomycetota bacterium]|nr:hypothetical protein [Planctomycetota bacterium]